MRDIEAAGKCLVKISTTAVMIVICQAVEHEHVNFTGEPIITRHTPQASHAKCRLSVPRVPGFLSMCRVTCSQSFLPAHEMT